jgi:hypothetical protein
MVQVQECLPGKCEALKSNPNTIKKRCTLQYLFSGTTVKTNFNIIANELNLEFGTYFLSNKW